LLDTAILDSSHFHGKALVERYKKLDEIPFDFTRRMRSVMVETPEGKPILLTKGAPEEIFRQCSQLELDGKPSPMDPGLMKGLQDEYASLSNDGFRVLAVAVKDLPGKQSCSKEDERDLVLKGYVAFLNPPKGTAAIAIQAPHKHGVGVAGAVIEAFSADKPIVGAIVGAIGSAARSTSTLLQEFGPALFGRGAFDLARRVRRETSKVEFDAIARHVSDEEKEDLDHRFPDTDW
jgi:hypothetical protein